MITTILLIAALVCFILGAFGVPSRVNWTDAGLALATAAVLAGRFTP
jgi:4-amino-4-deoxy-L-arabinose transferase-like glycosyltransferase